MSPVIWSKIYSGLPVNMTLTAAERFLILAHHPVKANYVIPEQTRNAGMIGSILLDLAAEDKIKIENGMVLVRSTNTKLLLPHRVVLQRMHQSTKPRKVKTWISRFAQAPGRHHREILTALERKGIVRIDRKKFLFIPYWRTSLIKSSEREEMIREMQAAVINAAVISSTAATSAH